MKILGRTQPLGRYPIMQCLTVIKRLGFDGAEICLENADISPGLLTEARACEIGEYARALGLAPYSISYHKDYIHDDTEFELTRRAIQLTPIFGASVFVFAGAPAKADHAAEWQRVVDRTGELVRAAESSNVVLAEEFEPGFIVGSTHDLLRLFAAIPSAFLAANLDLGHAFLCDPDPLESIRLLKDKVVHCHVENMRSGVHAHMLPWEGDMALKDYMTALYGIGFDGGLALDLYLHDYEAVAPECCTYLNNLLREVKSKGAIDR